MAQQNGKPFASLFDELEREPKIALLADPVANDATMEVSSAEVQQILRATEAVHDPFNSVKDAPGLDKAVQATIECAPWDTRLSSAPRPITLAGDLPKSPRDITYDDELEAVDEIDEAGARGDAFFSSDLLDVAMLAQLECLPEPSLDIADDDDDDDTSLLDIPELTTFPFEKPPPVPEEASFDDAIRAAVDPFGFGGHPVVVEEEEVTGEWTTPELHHATPTRVSAPDEADLERAKELYMSAIEQLAMQRRGAALVHARLALGYDPDNTTYQAFCDDIIAMIGRDSISASGSLPVLDADIVGEVTGDQYVL